MEIGDNGNFKTYRSVKAMYQESYSNRDSKKQSCNLNWIFFLWKHGAHAKWIYRSEKQTSPSIWKLRKLYFKCLKSSHRAVE